MIPSLNIPADKAPTASGRSGSRTKAATATVGQRSSRVHSSTAMVKQQENGGGVVTVDVDGEGGPENSGSLARRAADVQWLLEMDVLSCSNVPALRHKLIEMAEKVVMLENYYEAQLRERASWFKQRLATMSASLPVHPSSASNSSSFNNNSNSTSSPQQQQQQPPQLSPTQHTMSATNGVTAYRLPASTATGPDSMPSTCRSGGTTPHILTTTAAATSTSTAAASGASRPSPHSSINTQVRAGGGTARSSTQQPQSGGQEGGGSGRGVRVGSTSASTRPNAAANLRTAVAKEEEKRRPKTHR